MTRFRVFGEAPKPEPEKEVFFRLREESDGTILLYAVDKYGKGLPSGNILALGKYRGIVLCCAVNLGLGLPRDEQGRVVVFRP